MAEEKIVKLYLMTSNMLKNYDEDVLFSDMPKMMNDLDNAFSYRNNLAKSCDEAISVFEKEEARLESEIQSLIPQIDKAHDEYLAERNREEAARKKYEKYMDKYRDYESQADSAYTSAKNNNDSSYISQGNRYRQQANEAYATAQSAKREADSCQTEAYYRIYSDLQRQKEAKEKQQEMIKQRRSHLFDAKEFLNKYDEEKEYYKSYLKHQMYSALLKQFDNLIQEFKGITLKEDPMYIELKKVMNEGVIFLTDISIKHYKEYKDLANQSRDKGGSNFYYSLANRFEILASDDITTPEIKEPISFLLCKKAYNDATNMKDEVSYTEEPCIHEERFECKDPKKESGFIDIKENVILSRKTMFNNIDNYYKKIKKSLEFYINESNNNIQKIIKMIDDGNEMKIDKVIKCLNEYMKEFKKNNEKYNEFVEGDLIHPNTMSENNIDSNIEYIESEIETNFKKHLNDYPIGDYVFGIRRYFLIRFNDEKEIFGKEIDCYKMLNEYELIFVPLNRCKQEIIIEGNRIIWYLCIFEMIEKLKKLKVDENLYKEVETELENDSVESIKRIKLIKGVILDMQIKSRKVINEFIQFMNSLSSLVGKYKKHHFDVIYKEYVKRIKLYSKLLMQHMNNDYGEMNKGMLQRVDGLIEIYESKDICKFYKILMNKLPALPPPSLQESEKSKRTSKGSAKVAPFSSSTIKLENPPQSANSADVEEKEKIESKSDINRGYRLFIQLILWKYYVIINYYPSCFQWFYNDLSSILSVYSDDLYRIHGNRMEFENIFDFNTIRLKYSDYGDWSWRMYKSIRGDLERICKNKSVLEYSHEEQEIIQRIYYALSEFCSTCQSSCERVMKINTDLQRGYRSAFIFGMGKDYSQTDEGKSVIKYHKRMLEEVKGKGWKSCFSCCIPGININYQYAGNKWCKEKCKNIKKSKKLF